MSEKSLKDSLLTVNLEANFQTISFEMMKKIDIFFLNGDKKKTMMKKKSYHDGVKKA